MFIGAAKVVCYFRTMRYNPILALVVLLSACGNEPSSTTATITPTADTSSDAIEAHWPGYYTDTLPCADCPGIETSLWVRSDSSFILQQRYLDRDSIPMGTMGQWHVVKGLLTVGYVGDKPEFYRYTSEGLLTVDEMGEAFDSPLDHSLDKLADDIGDAIPRMRVSGTFTYMADAQSFQPCGVRFPISCIGGMDIVKEEGASTGLSVIDGSVFTNVDLQKAYAKAVKNGGDPWTIEAVCTMGMGPAMEGDGADEYVFIHRVIKEGVPCP